MNVLRTLVVLAGTLIGGVLVVGCGDVYADPDPPEDAPAADGGVVVVTDAAAVPVVFPEDSLPRCPNSRPRENSGCLRAGSTCEYGDSPDRECNTVVACEGDLGLTAWVARPRDTCFSQICPAAADVAALDGKPCELEIDGGAISDADETVCNMSDGICACTTGRDGNTRHERRWVCVRPSFVCPPNRPLLGTLCSGNVWCDYGSCSFKRGVVMECTQGVWLTAGATCQ